MKTTLSKNLRRTSLFFNALGTISIILSLVMAFFPQTGAGAASGRIWTTENDCGDLSQDVNHYVTWEWVHINGSGFAAGDYIWEIYGTPGSDTPWTIATDSITIDATGNFCVRAHQVQPDEGGEYKVNLTPVGGGPAKNDNYQVSPAPSGSIDVIKDVSPASVPETGGDVDFTVTVTNTDDALSLELTSLIDDVFGNLNGIGTCSVPQTIVPLDSYICTFPAHLIGDVGTPHVDTVTGAGEDENLNPLSDFDSASVAFDDVLPAVTVTKSAAPTSVNEPGGAVTFTITVTNDVDEELTLDSLADDTFGDLNGQGTCAVPQTLAPSGDTGDSYTCSFSAIVNGQPGDTHTNVVTGSATDNEGNPAEDDDSADVTFNDVLPLITVVKTADPTTVPAPSAPTTYFITVTNLSTEAVTLNSLDDDIYGDLNGQGDCTVPQALAASGETGDSYSCSFVAPVDAFFGETLTDVVTATAVDDDGSLAEASDDASVTVMDVEPNVGVEKTADPTSVPESGDDVTFTVTVTNTGPIPIVIFDLEDDQFGNLIISGDCADAFLFPLDPLEQYVCTFSRFLAGTAGQEHENWVTVWAVDSGPGGEPIFALDNATVSFTDVLPDITVDKTADPVVVSEYGETVTFTVVVTNNSTIPVELTTLVDDQFGDLNGEGDCFVPLTLDPGEFSTCSFTEFMAGEPGAPHTNWVTATAWDNGNSDTDSDDATVSFTDEPPIIDVYKSASPSSVPETGGDVTYTVTVYNEVDEPLTLDSLIDDQFGDLNGLGDCTLPQALGAFGDPSYEYTCSFIVSLSGEAGEIHTNTVTGSASDNDGNDATDNDDATVDFIDVLPEIGVVKTADPTLVDETGEDVTYSVTVTNYSDEALTLNWLIDDIYGDLDGNGTCAVPQTLSPYLDPGYQYSCTFTEFVSGPAGEDVVDWVEANASDNDGNEQTVSDDATVTVQDVEPNIQVEKTADPSSVPEAGENVTFTITVTNAGPVTMWLTGLTDNFFGDLDGMGSCDLSPYPVLDPGEQYICSFTVFLAGDEGEPHENTVTATGEDADDNVVTDEDPETVDFIDILPEILVTKTPSTTVVYAPGGNVTFTVAIKNLTAEPVTIFSLVDTVFGNLNGEGSCSVPQVLAAIGESGDTYQCSFTGYVGGPAGAVHNNIVTANGSDDDENPVSDDGGALVRILSLVTPPPFIPVTGVASSASGLPFSTLALGSLGMVFFGLGFAIKGYADRREEDES